MRINPDERSKERERMHLAAIKENSGKTWQELAEIFIFGSGDGVYGDGKELGKKLNPKNKWFSAGTFKRIDAIAVGRGWCKPYIHRLFKESKSIIGRPVSDERFDENGLPFEMPSELKEAYLAHNEFIQSAIELELRINELILAKAQFELAKTDYELNMKFEIYSNTFTELNNLENMRDFLISVLKDELPGYEKVIENSSLNDTRQT